MKQRLFVAIDLPDAVKKELLRIQNELKSSQLLEASFASIDNTHLTLKFLGDVEESEVDRVEQLLAKVRFLPIEAELGKVGMFANDQCEVRVIWVELKSPALTKLQGDIETALVPLSAKDERSFASHITLARVKKVNDRSKLDALISELAVSPLRFTANSFSLKRSQLSHTGSVHTVLHQFVSSAT